MNAAGDPRARRAGAAGVDRLEIRLWSPGRRCEDSGSSAPARWRRRAGAFRRRGPARIRLGGSVPRRIDRATQVDQPPMTDDVSKRHKRFETDRITVLVVLPCVGLVLVALSLSFFVLVALLVVCRRPCRRRRACDQKPRFFFGGSAAVAVAGSTAATLPDVDGGRRSAAGGRPVSSTRGGGAGLLAAAEDRRNRTEEAAASSAGRRRRSGRCPAAKYSV